MPDTDLDFLLRDGLRRLPAPVVSADFDARVLALLQQPPTWRQTLWLTLRPLLIGTACSLTATFAALAWTLHTPSAPAHPLTPIPAAIRPLDMAGLNRLLSRPGLSAATVSAWAEEDLSPPAPARRPPIPRRRASRSPYPFLTA